MKKILEYLDKEGINYTVNRDPSPEEIDRIKKAIERLQVRELFKNLSKDFEGNENVKLWHKLRNKK